MADATKNEVPMVINQVQEAIAVGAATPQQPATAAKPRRSKKPQPQPAISQEISAGRQLLFDKYDVDTVVVEDQSLVSYVRFGRRSYPNIFGRRKYQAYYNSHSDIVERLISKLMRGGTGRKISGKVIRRKGSLQGKKLKVVHLVREAFGSIQKKTGKNPVQVLVDALQNAAPIEDTTRVRYGGISYNVAVGISSQRRLDVALKNIALAALMVSFKSKKTIAEALANELMLAASNNQESYAIKKRIEAERIAKRAR
ncbi:30S ribosomal protein S7 [Candidatus Marsarchaeota archaeon]|nr:30S ribosomal protein S7 [Candidatus Marsarchaeota archaeon]